MACATAWNKHLQVMPGDTCTECKTVAKNGVITAHCSECRCCYIYHDGELGSHCTDCGNCNVSKPYSKNKNQWCVCTYTNCSWCKKVILKTIKYYVCFL